MRGDADADDVAQDALSLAYRKLGSYKGEGKFSSWVDRIVVRSAFAHLRRTKARQEVRVEEVEEAEALPGENGSSDYLARRRLVAALDVLQEDQRIALVMHHVLEMSVPEIAAEVSAPEETVRSRLRLGRARVRSLMLGEDA
jgi:RNA polymerase sigma-70 factor (ECF subfamily)